MTEINKAKKTSSQGFTMLEILLVIVIIASILTIATSYFQESMQAFRNDKTAAQMQQILNAGMAYYVANGAWPPDLKCLQGDSTRSQCNQQYLPATIISGWIQGYAVGSTASNFYVNTLIGASSSASATANAEIISGKLPLSYISNNVSNPPPYPAVASCNSFGCYVVASVTIPGQNLSNAPAINFAGLYHQGACVPVPTCPVDKNGNTMTPQVIIVPVQVSGTYDPANPNNVYPISSFTAYAIGGLGFSTNPGTCSGSTVAPSCSGGGGSISGTPATDYWRACMQLITERGNVQGPPNNWGGSPSTSWGGQVTMAAFTRCAVTNEPSGTKFNFYGN